MKTTTEKQVNRTLTFKLTKEEIQNMGIAAAEKSYELQVIQDEFDTIKKNFKAKIDLKQQELDGTLATIRRGTEDRRVDCTEKRDYEAQTVQYIYKGDVIEERAMKDHEKQLEITERSTDTEVPTQETAVEIAKHMVAETSAVNL